MTAPIIDLTAYDFVDFGCSAGGSIRFAQTTFGEGAGIGIDIDPAKVEKTRAAGYDAVLANATDPKQFRGRVRFTVLSHFLEHLPSFDAVYRSLQTAIRISDEFVFVRQPWFDCDGELFRNGLKTYWSDWHGHRMTLTSLQMYRTVRRALDEEKIARATIYGLKPIVNTDDECVIPLCAPQNSSKYDAGLHGPKIEPPLKLTAYRELVLIVAKTNRALTETLFSRLPGMAVIYDQVSGTGSNSEGLASIEDLAAEHALADESN